MKRLLVCLMLLATTAIAKDWAQPVRPECGGWENYMQVVVTQVPDPTTCLRANNNETCYTVTIIIYPTGEPTCRWDFTVRQATVDNVVKDFMKAYLP